MKLDTQFELFEFGVIQFGGQQFIKFKIDNKTVV